MTTVSESGAEETASVLTTVEAEPVQLPDIEPEPQASFEDSFTEPQELADSDVDSADSLAAEQLSDVVSEEETVVASSDLELSFTGDCWIDIRDANGRRLDTGIKKAGDVLKLDGNEPFRVVLGAPSVVTMSYKGEPVDLSRYPAGKVARLKLPQ